jgi:anti-anti-sigma regulatory factor
MVGIQGATAFIRVAGRGSFKVSPALKKFAQGALDQRCRQIFVDMGPCVGMDSTFMGVLAGLALRMKREGVGRVVMYNLSAKNRALVQTLGLDRLVRMHDAAGGGDEGLPAETEMRPLGTGEATRRATAETMLEAHEDLIRIQPENLPKFKDVLAYLKEDLKGPTGGEDAAR